ncbi:hypothetical protein BaRGS_00029426 [Batillaria attramentaria]|uniref:Uncharacterized protein n=1 Tax=Batillaria attramentaria TaxID=370345 RepID=A0ABD0JWS9_9CAEN
MKRDEERKQKHTDQRPDKKQDREEQLSDSRKKTLVQHSSTVANNKGGKRSEMGSVQSEGALWCLHFAGCMCNVGS